MREKKIYDFSKPIGRAAMPRRESSRPINGLDAYSNWVSRVQPGTGGRGKLNNALYTWKGYRDWADRIKQNWEAES